MAWGLEARVPFLDKKFLDVAMGIDPKEKMFSKGSLQETDADGRPKMEKVGLSFPCHGAKDFNNECSTFLERLSIVLRMARYTFTNLFFNPISQSF